MVQKVITNYSGDLHINNKVNRNLVKRIRKAVERNNYSWSFLVKEHLKRSFEDFDIRVFQTRSLYVVVRIDHFKDEEYPTVLWQYTISGKESKYNAIKDLLNHIKIFEGDERYELL